MVRKSLGRKGRRNRIPKDSDKTDRQAWEPLIIANAFFRSHQAAGPWKAVEGSRCTSRRVPVEIPEQGIFVTASCLKQCGIGSVRLALWKCVQSLKTEFPGVAAFDNAQTNPQHADVSLGVVEKCPGIDSDLLSLTPTACSETVRTHQNPLH